MPDRELGLGGLETEESQAGMEGSGLVRFSRVSVFRLGEGRRGQTAVLARRKRNEVSCCLSSQGLRPREKDRCE